MPAPFSSSHSSRCQSLRAVGEWAVEGGEGAEEAEEEDEGAGGEGGLNED